MKKMYLLTILIMAWSTSFAAAAQDVTKYIRYQHEDRISYGILEESTVHELQGDIFTRSRRTGKTMPVAQVTLLTPTAPRNVIAVGRSYKSHFDGPAAANPASFAKLPTSLIPHGAEIPYYADSTDLHFEGELVLIIGKTASRVPVDKAADYIFAVAPGNDVSERMWQKNDLQWLRAKAADGFGPVGPVMVRGVDYNNLKLETRVNGVVKQSARTNELIFSPARMLSYISQYVTLEPGDMIFTGTPGKTSAIQPGDVVEVELENVGILKNSVGPKQK